MVDQNMIFFELPFLFGFVWVEMVEPSLSALFGGSEVLSFGIYVEFFGDFTPFIFTVLCSRWDFLDQLGEHFIFLVDPLFVVVFFVEGDGLVLKEDVLLIGEESWEELPVAGSLNNIDIY